MVHPKPSIDRKPLPVVRERRRLEIEPAGVVRGLPIGNLVEKGGPMFRNLGLALQTLRQLREQSQSAVADAAGIGKSQLSKYENGKELPRLDSLAKVLHVLGCSPLKLLEIAELLDEWRLPDEITVRSGRSEDAGRLAQLVSRSPTVQLEGGVDAAELERRILNPEWLILVAEGPQGEIAGLLCVSQRGSVAQVSHLVVIPGPHEAGVVGALLKSGLAELERRGARRVGGLSIASSRLGKHFEIWGFRPVATLGWYEYDLAASREETLG